MSMAGRYKPPELVEQSWAWTERRSNDPLNQLARSLNLLCLEASDAYEIAAHLEALGYNSPELLSKYGCHNHFELAEKLFHQTPRRLVLTQPTKEYRQNLLKQIARVLALFVTIGIGLVAPVDAWAPVLWLLVWSQVGSALFSRAKSELNEPQQPGVLALLLALGLFGIAAIWFITPFSPAVLAFTLLWLGIAGLLWGERVRAALALPLLATALLGLHFWLGLESSTVFVGTACASIILLGPLLFRSTLQSWRWARSQADYLLPFALYGFGQGLLLMALLSNGHAKAQLLPGMLLFAAILLASEPLLALFRHTLTADLWAETDKRRYETRAQRTLLLHIGLYLLPFVPALYVWLSVGQHPWLFYWFGFALFGLVLALGLVSLSLGKIVTPAAIFLVGGLLSVLGVSFFPVAAMMVLVQLAVMLTQLRYIGSYGVHLL